jgi:hypothetical protein
MATALGKIIKWNNDRGLIEKGFDHKNEISFIVEELIEGHSDMESKKARKYSKFISWIIRKLPGKTPAKEDIVDSFADIIVFAVGAIAKLGYNPDLVMKEVQKELDDRTGSMIDGKFVKDKKDKPVKADFTKCKY